MKRILSFFISAFTLAFLICGCGTQYLGGDRIEKWEKDLNYLQEALPNKHANLFFKMDKNEFYNDIDNLKNNLSNMTDEEITIEIYRILAKVGDPHTKVYKEYEKRFPVIFSYFGDDIYLTHTSDDYSEAINCKLKAVNGIDVDEIKNRLNPLVSQANEAKIKYTSPSFLQRPDILKGVGIINDGESAVFTFENNKGNDFNLDIKAVDNESGIINMDDNYDENVPLYRQRSDLNYWYKYLEEDKILYFKYNHCTEYDEESGDINKVIDEMIDYIDKDKVNKIVIDIRDNGGGRDNRLHSLIDKIYESDLNDYNKFFVIVGKATFSASIVDACLIRKNTNATFLGEPTGGTPRHYGVTKGFSLPNSKLKISYSTTFVNVSDDYNESFMPDKKIEVTIDDYKNNIDPVMEFIKAK